MPPLWLMWLACALWLGAAAAAGYLLARRSSAAVLRDTRLERQALGQMLDVWQWHTDRQHRLVHLQPPLGAPPLDWLGRAGVPLWERFDSPQHPGVIRGKLEAHTALDDRVTQPDGSTWQLRGMPRFDEAGLFAGHCGTARLLDHAIEQAADHAAFKALLPTLPGPFWVASPAEGGLRIVRCNDAAQRLACGVGATWDELLARLPHDLARAVQALQPGDAGTHEGWAVHLMPVGDAGEGRLLALLPRPGLPEATEDNDSAAFSYTVSHDLRAPVRVVEGFTRILKEDYGRSLDRIGNDHLDRVLGAAARMNSMIDALLGLAQLSNQPLVRQPVNLSQLASYVVDDLRRQQPQRHVEVHIQPGLQAQGDPTLLRLVLENLLGNAWKYTGQRERAEITFEGTANDHGEGFVVRDNGAGFDMRFADRLFGVFQRLHSANDFPGTGVGLASARRIVRRHGGDVWAESEVGQGARFYFTLRS
ncbi:sensor histidine kinase [Aquincola agrisoli]|uniref:sensor histidine kinase n=1 Tax=Aquincola sp. GCM10022187 TaxID=3252634 RepID=UPI003672ED9D